MLLHIYRKAPETKLLARPISVHALDQTKPSFERQGKPQQDFTSRSGRGLSGRQLVHIGPQLDAHQNCSDVVVAVMLVGQVNKSVDPFL